jgi:hypothetical protein
VTALKGFAIILYGAWLVFGAAFGIQELVAIKLSGKSGEFVALSQSFGWWQFAVYGAWIIAALYGLYCWAYAVGEWREEL